MSLDLIFIVTYFSLLGRVGEGNRNYLKFSMGCGDDIVQLSESTCRH